MPNRRLLPRIIAVSALVVLVAAGCSKKTETTTGGAQKPVKLAFFGALTGPAAQLVIPGYQGAQLAVDQANAGKFGRLPVKIQLVKEDTQGNPTQAPPVATKIANDPSFVGVIGPAFSGESAAVGPTFDGKGIPFVTASATNPTLATNGWKNWFRANGNDNQQGPDGARYIADVLKPNCAFIASDDSTYGKGLGEIVQNKLQDEGIKVQAQQGAVTTGQKDFSALITKLKSTGCKAFFYGGYSPEAGLLRAQMTQAGLDDVTLVGGDGIKDSTYLTEAKAAGEGTVAVCPCIDITRSSDPASKTFIDDYKAKWGEDPGIYSGEYYDVARMFIEAFKAGKTARAAISSYLDGIKYTGLTKQYAFDYNHELDASYVKMYYWKDQSQNWSFVGLSTDVLNG